MDTVPIVPTDPVVSPQMRSACKKCGGMDGVIETKGGQDVVRCAWCNTWNYNAPKTETGRAVRSVSTVHEAIKPKQRGRVLLRSSGHCEICGKKAELHVGHLLSVKRGLEQGMTEFELNSDENLAAMCAECNLGIGDAAVPLRLAIGMIRARIATVEVTLPDVLVGFVVLFTNLVNFVENL